MAQVAWLEHPGYSMRDSTFMLLRHHLFLVGLSGGVVRSRSGSVQPGCSGARGVDGVVLWRKPQVFVCSLCMCALFSRWSLIGSDWVLYTHVVNLSYSYLFYSLHFLSNSSPFMESLALVGDLDSHKSGVANVVDMSGGMASVISNWSLVCRFRIRCGNPSVRPQ